MDASSSYTLTVWGPTDPTVDAWIQTFAAENVTVGAGGGFGFKDAVNSRVFVDTHTGDAAFVERLKCTVK